MLTLADSPSLATTGSPPARGGGDRERASGGWRRRVRLGARGYRVTVLERLDQPGGRARVHRQVGFTFDAGPTIVTAPFLFEELWSLCGRRMADDVTLAPMLPFYESASRTAPPSTTAATGGDAGEWRGSRPGTSPATSASWSAAPRSAGSVRGARARGLLLGPRHAADHPVPAALGGHRSVYDLVARHIRDERLRTIFSFHPC